MEIKSKRIQSIDYPSQTHTVIEESPSYYFISDVNNVLTPVPKRGYREVTDAVTYEDVTGRLTIQGGDQPCSQGKVNLYDGHKRVGYFNIRPPYRARRDGNVILIERKVTSET